MIPRLRTLAGRLVEALPERLSVALRPKRYRYSAADAPPPPVPPSTQTRLFIGPANFAGQGWLIARAAERLPDVGAVAMHLLGRNRVYGFSSDNPVDPHIHQHSAHWRRRQFAAVSRGFTHVIVEAGRPLFGKLFDHDVVREVEALRRRGVRVAMLAHGSELRLPSRHRELDEWSPFADADWADIDRLETGALRYRALLDAINVPVFVTTPELILDRPGAQWLPLVVDPARWATDDRVLERNRPIVIHAPTHPIIKGTALIEPVLTRLHDEGVIEYRRVTAVPSSRMPAVYAGADIVLEQFRIGTYSVAAIEAMAAGRVVIAHLHEQVRDHVRAQVGREIPVVSATPATIEAVLRDIVGRREHYRALAADAPGFVAAVHDGAATAETLRPFLCDSA